MSNRITTSNSTINPKAESKLWASRLSSHSDSSYTEREWKHTVLSKRSNWATVNGGFRARGSWGIAENAEGSLCWSGRGSCSGFAWLVNTHTQVGQYLADLVVVYLSRLSHQLPNGRIIILPLAQDLTWTTAIFSPPSFSGEEGTVFMVDTFGLNTGLTGTFGGIFRTAVWWVKGPGQRPNSNSRARAMRMKFTQQWPIDIVKVRLQTTTQYSSALDGAAQILKNEGPLAFYKVWLLS